MGFKSKGKSSAPAAPAAPDPVATAQAQGQANVDTARVNFSNQAANQYTPYGNLEWQNPAPDRWNAIQTLNPRDQHILEQQRTLDTQMNDIAGTSLNRAAGVLSSPMNTSGLTPYAQARYLSPTYGAVDYAQTRYLTPATGAVEYAAPRYLTPADAVGHAEAPKLNNTQYYADQLMQRQQPQFQRQRDDIRTTLTNQGIREGTEAWQRGMDDYNRAQNDATLGAQLSAGQEQTRQYGLASQAADYQNQLRATQIGEHERAYQYHTQADQAQNALRQAQIGEHERAYQYGVDADTRQNQLRQAQIGENERAFQFNNQSDQYNNQLRQQQLQEQAYLRQLPLNEITALMSGQQLQGPSFVNTPGFNSQAAPIADTTYQSYAGQQNAYNQAMQQQTANRAGMYGLMGTGLMAGAMAFSDERLKADIEMIGSLQCGIPIYGYRYKWDMPDVRRIGVMAQDVMKVIPEAVGNAFGYLTVNYSMIR